MHTTSLRLRGCDLMLIESSDFVKFDFPEYTNADLTNLKTPHIRFMVFVENGQLTLDFHANPFFMYGSIWAYSPKSARSALTKVNAIK